MPRRGDAAFLTASLRSIRVIDPSLRVRQYSCVTTLRQTGCSTYRASRITSKCCIFDRCVILSPKVQHRTLIFARTYRLRLAPDRELVAPCVIYPEVSCALCSVLSMEHDHTCILCSNISIKAMYGPFSSLFFVGR